MDPTELRHRRAASTALAALAITSALSLLLAAAVPMGLVLAPVAGCWAVLFGGLAIVVAPRRTP